MSTLRRTHPRYADQLRKDSAKALASTARMGKIRAQVFGLCPSDESRQVNARTPGVVGRFYEYVAAAVLEDKADAGELIARAMVVAEEAAYTLGQDECKRRWLRACAQEQVFQTNEDLTTHDALIAVLEEAEREREALEAQDDALCSENGVHFDVIIYNRAYRQHRGWRVGPGERK